MKYRVTRVVPESFRVKGLEPFFDAKVCEVLPSYSDINKMVDECHYVVLESVPDQIPNTEEL